ncbi:hypothetical protein RBH26_06130 [Natronolimnohabitans sp. A-GB9]|uniref:hypothetical protein n=1 Tax=Natronolimnohabitans sp. A-GB9 TaxID=3069757 RepID=UPI0027B750E6|nr:hypothetical protein [Natronolimnohabitans sp. A-GB9]MDQ2050058.1 hypothetical protein [Natronolimnohabitans sp. A-GB9]
MSDLDIYVYDAARSIGLIILVILASLLVDSLNPLPVYIAIILTAVLFPIRRVASKYLYWIMGIGVFATGTFYYLFDGSMLAMIVFGAVSAILFMIPKAVNKQFEII